MEHIKNYRKVAAMIKKWREQHKGDNTVLSGAVELLGVPPVATWSGEGDTTRISQLLKMTENAETVGDLERAFAEVYHLPYWDKNVDDAEWAAGFDDELVKFVKLWREAHPGRIPLEHKKVKEKTCQNT